MDDVGEVFALFLLFWCLCAVCFCIAGAGIASGMP